MSDKTGVPVGKVDVVLGDSSLVPDPMSGGSTATASVIPSVPDGTSAAVRILLASAVRAPGSPFLNQDPATLGLTAGRVHAKGQDPEAGLPFDAILRMANIAGVSGDGKSGGQGSDTKASDYSMHSFGAQLVKVEWQPAIARSRDCV